ncbi:pyrroloquinoline quinone biosynthesis peptide chaperone PqqD [Nitrogeniibacter aestuarii]|uniref:pyrroloquinoline quinone biosynthesis peptide chaperone PqqD n=1 Tax=Nitrogeniibacter aestuarii TaxID=2815343 RepID=UPI001D114EED|nr:pyrroloquinoline quinone biosynthesis peptide chaperone PqqD [Nitrogeniibacter aestuarii]
MSDAPAINTPKVSSHFRLQFEQAQDAWVLLYPEGMIKLNPSAGEIMKRCDGTRDVPALVAELESTFQTEGLEPDVRAFLEMAQKQHWIVEA